MSSYIESTIGEVCARFSSGKNISASKIKDNDLYPVYGGNGLRGYTDTYNFEGECAIIGRQGAYCGNVRYFKGKAYMTEHAIVACAKKEFNIGYLSYLFSLMHLEQYQGQSAQPGLSVNTLSKVKVVLPRKEVQDRVFVILRILEEKIENNNAIKVEFEAMAKTMYDYWFLQFDFPDESGKPYKSSGGKMVWNEELRREIPEGWGVGNLYDIADFVNGLACQKFRPLSDDRKLPVIKITEMHDGITASTEFVRDDIPEKNIVFDGDILFSWSATLETMIWTGEKAGLNQHIFKVIPKNYAKYYVYMQLSSYIINFVKMAEARKTTMGHITTDHIKQSRIPLPPKDIALKYNNTVEDTFKKIIMNKEENRELTSLRDFLLPLLMNGQVGFKE